MRVLKSIDQEAVDQKNDKKLQQSIFQIKKNETEAFRRRELLGDPSSGENLILGLEGQESKDIPPGDSHENSPEQPSSLNAGDTTVNDSKIKQKAKVDELKLTIDS